MDSCLSTRVMVDLSTQVVMVPLGGGPPGGGGSGPSRGGSNGLLGSGSSRHLADQISRPYVAR